MRPNARASLISACPTEKLVATWNAIGAEKKKALSVYTEFSREVISGESDQKKQTAFFGILESAANKQKEQGKACHHRRGLSTEAPAAVPLTGPFSSRTGISSLGNERKTPHDYAPDRAGRRKPFILRQGNRTAAPGREKRRPNGTPFSATFPTATETAEISCTGTHAKRCAKRSKRRKCLPFRLSPNLRILCIWGIQELTKGAQGKSACRCRGKRSDIAPH